ncbi:hypothetical protein [Novosphingobium mathurense]|uniref:Uncharacterized protein n=1 Tax=Novosphingobium mathurense TaxID=428990 RepID=A0A1U6I7L3_9SPHN|nr:hypothetical protein [Novosphingobium mathurense]SLK04004.1 hypothetical protein SAMN06295987_104323 [Novosphingobium mathurense]
MNLTDPATDWTNQTWEERLEMCVSTLYVHGYMGDADKARTMERIRARAEIQREASPATAKGDA